MCSVGRNTCHGGDSPSRRTKFQSAHIHSVRGRIGTHQASASEHRWLFNQTDQVGRGAFGDQRAVDGVKGVGLQAVATTYSRDCRLLTSAFNRRIFWKCCILGFVKSAYKVCKIEISDGKIHMRSHA